MGVQDRDRAGCALEFGIALAELAQGLPTAVQQLFVDELLMRKCQWAQLGRQGPPLPDYLSPKIKSLGRQGKIA